MRLLMACLTIAFVGRKKKKKSKLINKTKQKPAFLQGLGKLLMIFWTKEGERVGSNFRKYSIKALLLIIYQIFSYLMSF
jgi:hypothetical protein